MEASPQRGRQSVEFARIVAFTDGVFAIAITLLVLNFDVPAQARTGEVALSAYVSSLGGDVLAYFLTFAVVGRLWLVHHRLFSTLQSFDSRLMVLNLLYLSMIALMPYPAELLGDYGEQRIPVVIYAGVLGVASSLHWFMVRHAVRAGLVHDFHVSVTESWASRDALVIPGVFLVSIPIAFISPLVAQMIWVGLVLARIARAWAAVAGGRSGVR